MTPALTAAFLQHKYGDVGGVEPIGAGAWSRALAFEHDGERLVIRWSATAESFAKDALASRFARDGLPVVPILEIGREGDMFFAISPFVAGDYFEALPPAELARTLPSLLGLLRALRGVDLTDTTGYGGWDKHGNGLQPSWQAFLLDDKDASPGSLIQGWRAKLAASPLGIEAFERLWRRFLPLVARVPNERQVVHSDLLNRNLLAAGGRITALLDWGSAFYGDALYDVVWFTFFAPWHPELQRIDLARTLLDDFLADPNANTADIETRVACYRLHIGLDWIAYNAFREDWPRVREAVRHTERVNRAAP